MTEQLINILDPDFRRDPYPTYAKMRRDSPVCRVDPGGMWAVSRHEDMARMFKNPSIFSSAGFRSAWEPSWVGYNPLARAMHALDGIPHTRLRALVQRAFNPLSISRLEQKAVAKAQEVTRELGGDLEAVEAVGTPLPTYIIGEILGIDTRLHRELKRWTDDILSVTPMHPGEEKAARIRGSIRELTGFVTETIEARRREPRADTVSALVQAQVDGQSLTTSEIVDFLVLLVVAGMETTVYLLSHSLRLFSVWPELFDTVRADRSCIGGFIEEILRYEGVVPMLPRMTTQEVEMQGVKIPAGEMVAMLLPSANRDEQVFEDPDRFDIKRDCSSAIAFGLGPHFCLGAGLARMELRVMLTEILDRVKRIEALDDKLEYNCALIVRGPVALRLRFTPA
jgi:cytochrome P450